jgi:hypothetical protein
VGRVYVSLPLTGPTAPAGRDVLQGARVALETANGAAPELVVLEGFAADRDGPGDRGRMGRKPAFGREGS